MKLNWAVSRNHQKKMFFKSCILEHLQCSALLMTEIDKINQNKINKLKEFISR